VEKVHAVDPKVYILDDRYHNYAKQALTLYHAMEIIEANKHKGTILL
jgi:hypothetical protein